MSRLELELNGTPVVTDAEPHESLFTVLRRLGMFSVKYGSATGETGAAAVLVDGRLASSDVMFAHQAGGHSVTTVEALNTERDLHPIQAPVATKVGWPSRVRKKAFSWKTKPAAAAAPGERPSFLPSR